MKKKKIVVFITIIVLLVIILTVTSCVISKRNEDNKNKKSISKIVNKFYEDSYYNAIPKELLKDFKDKGIKLSLKELFEFEELSTKEYKIYNLNKSWIIIYPKSPYEKKDYDIKIKLYRN